MLVVFYVVLHPKSIILGMLRSFDEKNHVQSEVKKRSNTDVLRAFFTSECDYFSVKTYFSDKRPAVNVKPTEQKPAKKPRKPIRSIEINPDEVDRIYVKKAE